MRAEVDARPARKRRRARRLAFLRAVPWKALGIWAGSLVVALALGVGVLYAGSADAIPAGVRIAGVDVGGMSAAEAEALLEERAHAVAGVPVVFTVAGRAYKVRPDDLQARIDWAAYVAEAQAKGDWPMPFRGLKRVSLRLFGADVEPVADVYEPALALELDRMAKRVDRPGRDAAIVLNGLEPELVSDREGRALNRRTSGDAIVRALAALERRPVALPVDVAPPKVRAAQLEPLVEQVRIAVSAPVRMGWHDAHWLVRPAELADFLELPADGRTTLAVGGEDAERYLGGVARAVNRKPREASFAVAADGEHVRVVPSALGRTLDAEATGKALLAGALSTDRREAELVVSEAEPRLTTEKAKAMKVTRVLASYYTPYSGTYDRIKNLQLATRLIDGTRLMSGQTFSFNDVVGPRTEKRGFRVAPTIVDNEYEDAVGGGVSQVATTTFNAAWEAGVKIPVRHAHSLYIGRYPLGRDATVNYPDVDLQFVNDTGNWIVMRGESGETGITIRLLGAPTNRRVVSAAGELKTTGKPKVEHVPDPTLHVGEKVVEDEGEPSRSVTVTRTVYEGDKILYQETWTTSYYSEPKIVRVGTIPVEEPPPPEEPAKPGKDKPAAGTTTTTTPTTTGPRPRSSY
jgi:vancomycin resistance protein YoaR